MKERFNPEEPDDAEAKLLASLDFETENPRLQAVVGPATLVVIVEYALDRKFGVAQAVDDLLRVGMLVDGNRETLQAGFPDDRRNYEPPVVDPEWFKREYIDVLIDPMTRIGLKGMCEERGLNEATMLAHLVELAHKVRILHKMGAIFALLQPDESLLRVKLFDDDQQN